MAQLKDTKEALIHGILINHCPNFDISSILITLSGADIQSGDGIYTATILRECTRNDGRHSSRVLITGTSETVVGLYFDSKSAMIGKKGHT